MLMFTLQHFTFLDRLIQGTLCKVTSATQCVFNPEIDEILGKLYTKSKSKILPQIHGNLTNICLQTKTATRCPQKLMLSTADIKDIIKALVRTNVKFIQINHIPLT